MAEAVRGLLGCWLLGGCGGQPGRGWRSSALCQRLPANASGAALCGRGCSGPWVAGGVCARSRSDARGGRWPRRCALCGIPPRTLCAAPPRDCVALYLRPICSPPPPPIPPALCWGHTHACSSLTYIIVRATLIPSRRHPPVAGDAGDAGELPAPAGGWHGAPVRRGRPRICCAGGCYLL